MKTLHSEKSGTILLGGNIKIRNIKYLSSKTYSKSSSLKSAWNTYGLKIFVKWDDSKVYTIWYNLRIPVQKIWWPGIHECHVWTLSWKMRKGLSKKTNGGGGVKRGSSCGNNHLLWAWRWGWWERWGRIVLVRFTMLLQRGSLQMCFLKFMYTLRMATCFTYLKSFCACSSSSRLFCLSSLSLSVIF